MTLEPTLSNRLNTPNISKPKAVDVLLWAFERSGNVDKNWACQHWRLRCVAIKDGPLLISAFLLCLLRPHLKKRRKQEDKKGHGHYWGNVGEAYLHTNQSNLNTPCQDGGEIGGHSRSKEKGTRFLGCFAFILLNLDFSCHASCWSMQTAAKQANSAPVNWLPYVLGGLFA